MAGAFVYAPDGRLWRLIPLDERIALRVDKSGGPDACWPWTGAADCDGYGFVTISGKRVGVTRVIMKTPAHLFALHRCDNPPCCNPAHLWNGTRGENITDMYTKGRGRHNFASGEQHGMAKLRREEVVLIKEALAAGYSLASLARLYGVTADSIGNIAHGRNWRSV